MKLINPIINVPALPPVIRHIVGFFALLLVLFILLMMFIGGIFYTSIVNILLAIPNAVIESKNQIFGNTFVKDVKSAIGDIWYGNTDEPIDPFDDL